MPRHHKSLPRVLHFSTALKSLHFSVAVYTILALVLLGWMMVMLQSFKLVGETDERITAINEAQTVLNLLRAANTDPELFPGNVVDRYPAGELNPARTMLPHEVVTIFYVDPTSNPLSVTIFVRYDDIDEDSLGPDEVPVLRIESLSTLLSNF